MTKIKYNPSYKRWYFYHKSGGKVPFFVAVCPYGVPGDKLYVKQRWRTHETTDGLDGILYADDSFVPIKPTREDADKWMELHNNGKYRTLRPAMFMPARWALIHIEITGVSVEQLQSISEDDAIAEGCVHLPSVSATANYRLLWNKINAKTQPWSNNPWVWKLNFKRVSL